MTCLVFAPEIYRYQIDLIAVFIDYRIKISHHREFPLSNLWG